MTDDKSKAKKELLTQLLNAGITFDFNGQNLRMTIPPTVTTLSFDFQICQTLGAYLVETGEVLEAMFSARQERANAAARMEAEVKALAAKKDMEKLAADKAAADKAAADKADPSPLKLVPEPPAAEKPSPVDEPDGSPAVPD